MISEKDRHMSEHLKRHLEQVSGIDIDEEDISLLMSTLERPLTMVEMTYFTGLKLAVCCARVRKLINAGLLCRFSPKTSKGLSRGGIHVYQASESAVSSLAHHNGERY